MGYWYWSEFGLSLYWVMLHAPHSMLTVPVRHIQLVLVSDESSHRHQSYELREKLRFHISVIFSPSCMAVVKVTGWLQLGVKALSITVQQRHCCILKPITFNGFSYAKAFRCATQSAALGPTCRFHRTCTTAPKFQKWPPWFSFLSRCFGCLQL